MDRNVLKDMLVNIPTKLCRTMNLTIVSGILTDFPPGFTKNHLTIVRLLAENGPMYITEIVDVVGITKPQMTATIDKLINMGHVNRMYNENDRRKIFLELTKEGQNMAAKSNENIELVVNKLLADLSENEIAELATGLKAFNKICSLCITRYNKKDKS